MHLQQAIGSDFSRARLSKGVDDFITCSCHTAVEPESLLPFTGEHTLSIRICLKSSALKQQNGQNSPYTIFRL